MTSNQFKIVVVSTMMTGLLLVGNAEAQCQANSPNCVDIAMQASGNPPTVHPPTIRFRMDVGGSKSQFSFGLTGTPGSNGTVYVVFKCQSYEAPLDCRTPAVHSNGDPTWTVMLTPNGVTGAQSLGALETCVDECSSIADDSEYGECVNQYCSYPYLVMDVRGNKAAPNPPADPVLIVDPR